MGGSTLPNTSFAALEDAEHHGFAVLTEGAHEYEHIPGKRALAFTLLRANGSITRDDATLKVGGGDQWLSPENQCLRKISLRFGVLPYQHGVVAAGIAVESVQFRAGLTAYYTSRDEKRFMLGRPAVQDTRIHEYYFHPDPYETVKIPDNQSLLTAAGDGMLVTALKKAEKGDSLILRAVNLRNCDSTFSVQAPGKLSLSNMSEDAADLLGENSADVPAGAKKIVTVKINIPG
jgi:alpha-mannosidase